MPTKDEIQERATAAFDELAAALEQGNSKQLTAYLQTMSRFHQYSFGNCILIALQKPDATHVAGFQRWKQLGRFVKSGERGIAILAPMAFRKKQTDDAAQESTVDESPEEGNEKSTRRRVRGFKLAFVFDVSQTDGKPLPEFATISGDPGEKLQRLEAVIHGHGISLSYEGIDNGALGVSEGGRIRVLPSLSQAETFSVLAHELAHELLHRGERRKETTKTIRETEAEAVAFVVCHASGVDSRTRSSDYIRLYNGDKELLQQSLEQIQKVSTSILSQLQQTPADVVIEPQEIVSVEMAAAI
ncbi:hypothetical protein Pan44_19200 [Caulifigura coniformis]|uniref:N-terminal domain-containing protein n=1 Tax=Caulifigura coniformis TaxID=2527983 RepID=A0A517SCP9_9PLAN|nr:ArdC-like ssDNA-binding domain-containing protein [Caulifigura coniformis]QDT53894.1 hypothetical protein Pan44_19200 [Caulifigura coniformis]